MIGNGKKGTADVQPNCHIAVGTACETHPYFRQNYDLKRHFRTSSDWQAWSQDGCLSESVKQLAAVPPSSLRV